MSYEKYGLTKIDAKGADHSKGVVAGPDGSFYKIDGFKSKGENEGGIDQNDGKVFSSSLESDAGVDYTNFNTPQDVENALRELGSPKSEAKPISADYDEMSPEYAEAKARTEQYKEDSLSGRTSRAIFENGAGNDTSTFLERYRLKLGERLANGNYRPPKIKDTDTEPAE